MKTGFTLIEFLIVLFILALLIVLILAGLVFFEHQATLDKEAQSIVQLLRLAQNKTVVSEADENYGIHFDIDQAVLFQGISYLIDDPNNETYSLDRQITISQINLNPATSTANVIFEKINGQTQNYGFLTLRAINDPSQSQTIYIEPSGHISQISTPAPVNDPINDSRHVHITFTRNLDTATEKIFLSFAGAASPQETIDIASYLSAGQINWSGTINTGGSDQIIRIHTHDLSNPPTIFCLHRDRRFNNESLKIDIGENMATADNLINYSDEGVITPGSSIWVQTPEIQ